MTKKQLLVIILLVASIFFIGVSGYYLLEKTVSTQEDMIPSPSSETLSGIIVTVYSKDGKNYIDVDLVEMNPDWFPGGMSGPAYQNDDYGIRSFEISPNASFIVGSPPENHIAFSEFRKIFDTSNMSYERYNPWDIVIVNDVVTEIWEHFVP